MKKILFLFFLTVSLFGSFSGLKAEEKTEKKFSRFSFSIGYQGSLLKSFDNKYPGHYFIGYGGPFLAPAIRLTPRTQIRLPLEWVSGEAKTKNYPSYKAYQISGMIDFSYNFFRADYPGRKLDPYLQSSFGFSLSNALPTDDDPVPYLFLQAGFGLSYWFHQNVALNLELPLRFGLGTKSLEFPFRLGVNFRF